MENQVSQSTDMLTIILMNLPLKSLMRFRCVSNRWLGFIKSDSLASKYLAKETFLLKCFPPLEEEPDSPDTFNVDQQHRVDPFFSFHDPDSPDSSVVLPTLYVPVVDDFYYLCAPSNGLFCLVDGNVVVLCNPALREFELIPPTPFSWPDGYSYFNFSGFGFDVRSNSYKILHFWYGFIVGDGSFRIDLYNSSTNSWRHIDNEVSLCNYNVRSDLVFNGAFHWLTKGEYGNIGVILTFDISTEIFKLFDLSNDDINSGHINSTLIVLNECLAVAVHMQFGVTDFVQVWVMKEYGLNESWTKELVINPHSFKRSYVCWKNEWLFVESYDQKLAFCALYANEFRQYQLPKNGYCCNALIFRPSLISVKKHFVGEKTCHGSSFMHNS